MERQNRAGVPNAFVLALQRVVKDQFFTPVVPLCVPAFGLCSELQLKCLECLAFFKSALQGLVALWLHAGGIQEQT